MLRRKPTVIELRLDTDKAEYEQLKRERENPDQQPTPIQQEQQRPATVADRIGLAGQQAAAAAAASGRQVDT